MKIESKSGKDAKEFEKGRDVSDFPVSGIEAALAITNAAANGNSGSNIPGMVMDVPESTTDNSRGVVDNEEASQPGSMGVERGSFSSSIRSNLDIKEFPKTQTAISSSKELDGNDKKKKGRCTIL